MTNKTTKWFIAGANYIEANGKFTAIYTDRLYGGNITCMKRIEQQENETIKQMLEREDVADGLVFLFHGHSQMQGE